MSSYKRHILCACALMASTLIAGGDLLDSERNFLWHEANSVMAAARSEADYLAAARQYQIMAEREIRNGQVFYNMGIAFLNAGANDAAIEAFLRAERYLGSSPDIANNLSIALARKAGRDDWQPDWQRMLLFWHFMLSTRIRTLLAASSFFMFWVFLTFRRLGAGRWSKYFAATAAFLCMLFATSSATSLHQEANARYSTPPLPPTPTISPAEQQGRQN